MASPAPQVVQNRKLREWLFSTVKEVRVSQGSISRPSFQADSRPAYELKRHPFLELAWAISIPPTPRFATRIDAGSIHRSPSNFRECSQWDSRPSLGWLIWCCVQLLSPR